MSTLRLVSSSFVRRGFGLGIHSPCYPFSIYTGAGHQSPKVDGCFNCYVERQTQIQGKEFYVYEGEGRERRQGQVRSFAKFGNKDKKKRGKDGSGGEASRNSFHIKLLDTPGGPGSKAFSEAEQEEFKIIGAEYNRMSMKEHRAEMKDLNMKLKLKREAIDMLPTSLLQQEAMIIDTNDGPTRRIPTWTPPIPNFDPAKYNVND